MQSFPKKQSISESIITIGLEIRLERLSNTRTKIITQNTCNVLATLNILLLIFIKHLKIRYCYSYYIDKMWPRGIKNFVQVHTIVNKFNQQYVASRIFYYLLHLSLPLSFVINENIHFKYRDHLVLIFDIIYFKTLMQPENEKINPIDQNSVECENGNRTIQNDIQLVPLKEIKIQERLKW